MILYSKIHAIYSKEEIYNMFPTITARKIIYSRDIVKPDAFIRYCSYDSINYTLKDFLEDYPKYTYYKSINIMFEIYRKGYSILAFRKKYNINSYLENMIRSGLDFNSPIENGYKIIEFMKYKIDIRNFRIDKYDTHIELFGEKEELIAFKEKYNIKYEVLYEPYKKEWHLAFNGMLADYIRLKK